MANIFFSNRHGSMSDAFERDLMQQSLANGEAISLMALFKAVHAGLLKAAMGTASYIKAVTKALNEARARDVKFCGSHW